jgi:ubiquinone/menaquinone biosynthesis C-methylase UbiE
MNEFTPLYQLDPTDRFSDRVEEYVKYRPTYPGVAIDAIVANLSGAVVADIGAGTGISSRLLADRGLQVWAIEPNAAMIAGIADHPQIKRQIAAAESTGLADQSVDLITAFQAFHWFKHDEALVEFHRILKPHGRIAVVWNDRDHSDAFSRRYGEVLQSISDKPVGIERMIDTIALLQDSQLFTQVQQMTFHHKQHLDLAGLLGLAKSRSYTPKAGTAYDTLLKRLTQLHQEFCTPAGFATMVYQTSVFLSIPRQIGSIARDNDLSSLP